jgi:hypothetical protein
MEQANGPAAVPTSFKAVAWVGMIWNTLGAALYVWAKLDPAAAAVGAPPAMQDYMANMPLYAHLGWSLGIWGSFLGSVLMLMGRRAAVTAFLVSLLGALVSFGAQAQAGVLDVPMTAFIVAIIALLLWYSRRAQGQGLLN